MAQTCLADLPLVNVELAGFLAAVNSTDSTAWQSVVLPV